MSARFSSLSLARRTIFIAALLWQAALIYGHVQEIIALVFPVRCTLCTSVQSVSTTGPLDYVPHLVVIAHAATLIIYAVWLVRSGAYSRCSTERVALYGLYGLFAGSLIFFVLERLL